MFELHLWGRESPIFMQTMHFMFGVGAMIIPQVAEPFLVESGDIESLKDSMVNMTETFHPEDVLLVYPYSFVGAYLTFNAILTITIWYYYPVTEAHPTRESESDDKADDDAVSRSPHFMRYKVMVIMLTAAFMHIYYGLQISFGSFLMTFAVKSEQLNLTKTDGAYISTLFWLTITLQRIVTVTLLDKLSHEMSILLSLSIILVANACLTPFANSSATMLWIGVGLTGVGMSSIWPSIFGFLEMQFQVTSVIGSIIIMSAIVGEFVFPVIISSFISDYPQVLLLTVLCCSVSITLIFLIVLLICKLKLKR